jgi:hypothetical protein
MAARRRDFSQDELAGWISRAAQAVEARYPFLFKQGELRNNPAFYCLIGRVVQKNIDLETGAKSRMLFDDFFLDWLKIAPISSQEAAQGMMGYALLKRRDAKDFSRRSVFSVLNIIILLPIFLIILSIFATLFEALNTIFIANKLHAFIIFVICSWSCIRLTRRAPEILKPILARMDIESCWRVFAAINYKAQRIESFLSRGRVFFEILLLGVIIFIYTFIILALVAAIINGLGVLPEPAFCWGFITSILVFKYPTYKNDVQEIKNYQWQLTALLELLRSGDSYSSTLYILFDLENDPFSGDNDILKTSKLISTTSPPVPSPAFPSPYH